MTSPPIVEDLVVVEDGVALVVASLPLLAADPGVVTRLGLNESAGILRALRISRWGELLERVYV